MLPEFDRGIEDGSTEFSFSRFLTPYLCGYQGQAIFMDCDMIVNGDIYDVLDYCDLKHDVFVVKHNYQPKHKSKFLGNTQTAYPKKNWSSFMVFNNFMQPVKKLTPEVVSIQSGAYLHQFKWTNEDRIGELPPEWNHLVGEYSPNEDARVVHFTLGTPCFNDYKAQEWAGEWWQEREMMLHADQ
jgi:lipopolysaccharide biosynthesis glycosyltransferase